MKRILLLCGACFALIACASKKEIPQPRPHRATVVNDLFQVEQGMPVREVRAEPFYFKKCEVSQRKPYFSKTEYDCTEIP